MVWSFVPLFAYAELSDVVGDAPMIIDGRSPEALVAPGVTDVERITVDGQVFALGLRVTVAEAVRPVWDAQVVSPSNRTPIAAGDVLFGYFDIRADTDLAPEGGYVVGWLQAQDQGWEKVRKVELSPGPTWSRRYFSATAARDFPAGAVNLCLHLGTVAQQLDVGEIVVWNLGPDADIDALPRTKLTYAGQAPDAPWRAEAAERIERHRKADLTVRVIDADGKPVPDAQVEVELTRHAFHIGTFLEVESPVIRNDADAERFREVVKNNFNRVTVPIYAAGGWGWSDPDSREDFRAIIDWAVANDFYVSAHPVLWSRFDLSPPAWSALRDDPAALEAATFAHLDAILPELRQRGVDSAELLNEPINDTELDDIIGKPDLRARWFEHAGQVEPGLRYVINEFDIISSAGLDGHKQDAFAEQVRTLLDADVPLGAIGFQCHIGEDFTPPTRMWAVFDRFAEFGLPLYVSEFDVNTEDEQLQADYTRDFVTAAFAHPAIEGVTFWGFWEGQMW
ncbi:MAG: endo-1,4-beta-xylanase, partial [Planctomycetota bacterium]